MHLFLLSALFVLLPTVNSQLEEVVAVLTQGKIIGWKLYTAESSRPYLAFSNIPYAKPPLGNLRFKPPQDPPSWRGVRVLKFPPVCFQWVRVFEASNFFGQEDCLYINVFTPVVPLNKNAKLPVIVCIHGGDFQRGSSYECPANNFMERNVVFVSFNYRLGIFGFMSAGDEIIPGNYGLKDQVAALKWVHENIKSFGGDPDRVTIMGQGAGGASVHYHLYSPLSKGLFQSAISQSGTVLQSWSYTPPDVARNRTIAMATFLKCPTDSVGEIYMCLSKIQAKILAEMQPKLSVWFSEPNTIFTPTVELSKSKTAFLLEDPWKGAETNIVPWLVGFNSGEGAVKSSAYFGNNGLLLEKLNNETDKALPVILGYDITAKLEDIPFINNEVKKFYFKNKPVTYESAMGLINLFTDSMFSYGCMKAAARYTGTKYFYFYDHILQNSFSEWLTAAEGCAKYKMAAHGDEFMNLLYIPWWYQKKEALRNDIVVSQRMLNFWINFIENGNPNGKSSNNIWKPMQSNKYDYLRITTKEDQMESNLLSERYQFWDKLPTRSRINQRKENISRDEL